MGRITFLGTGDPLNEERAQTSLAVALAGGETLLLDTSSGTILLRQLAAAGVALPSIRHLFVTHRHFEVNGKTVNVPSYQLKVGDELKVRPSNGVFDVALDASKVRPVPSWLAFNLDEKTAKILARPERQEMESGVEEQLIVEFYSR